MQQQRLARFMEIQGQNEGTTEKNSTPSGAQIATSIGEPLCEEGRSHRVGIVGEFARGSKGPFKEGKEVVLPGRPSIISKAL